MNPKISRIVIAAVLACAAVAALAPLAAAQEQTVRLKVTAEQANLREKPDIGSAVVQQIPEGTVLEADRKEGEWYLVRYALEDGGVIAGYIHESLVAVMARPEGGRVPAGRETKPPDRRPRGTASQAVPEGGLGAWSGVPPFDVSFSAGGSTLVADDLNKGARGLAGLNTAALDATPIGSIGSLHLTYLFGFDASCRLSRNFSLALGIEYMRGWRSGLVTYPGLIVLMASGPLTSTHVFVQAVPVKLGLRFYPRPDFYIRTSAVYYFIRAGYDDRLASSAEDWQAWTGRVTARTLGMEVAAGGEWRLGPHVVGFAEAGFRLTPAVGLEGTGTSTASIMADGPVTESGPLWFYEQRGADGRGHDLVFVHAAAPSGADILGARKASLNLSGTTLRLGVRFRV